MFCEHCGSLISMTVWLDSCDTPMVIWCMDSLMDGRDRTKRGDVLGCTSRCG